MLTVAGAGGHSQAPEILKGTGHNNGADYWSLGVLIYEMLFGYTPFGSDDDSEICRNILSGSLQFEGKLSKEGKELIKKLLNRDCRQRLGMGKQGVKEIFKHPWFSSLDWAGLEKHTIPAPFIPDVRDDLDVSNFDEVEEENLHKTDGGHCSDKTLDAVFGDV
jgi:serine/threonine protein kinase